MKKIATFGKWLIEYNLNDGARISRLSFNEFDLLAIAPKKFTPPTEGYGAYETRPVYGYDDCFPSVDSGLYPNADWLIPDHGELCWLEWDVEYRPDMLIFSVKSEMLPVVFQRSMKFRKTSLIWNFKVINNGGMRYPFQHVMHPLIRLNQIKKIHFPDFGDIWNEEKESILGQTPERLTEMLLSSREEDVYMLYLQNIQKGSVSWEYLNGLNIRMDFPVNRFQTLGVWWNNSGYPNEFGCRRNECAFEPIAGQKSSLLESYEKNLCQFVDAKSQESWEITWSVND